MNPRSESEEILKRTSERTAALLAVDQSTASELSRELSELYKWRSCVVHGRRGWPKNIHDPDIRAFDVFVRVLQALIEWTRSIDKVTELTMRTWESHLISRHASYCWPDADTEGVGGTFSPRAVQVTVTDHKLSVDLEDGRTVAVPIAFYPRLAHGTPAERENFQISGAGHGIHWPDLDEDIGVEGLLMGRKSTESATSFERWRTGRA